MPVIMPNFIALRQTMYKKCYKIFTLVNFGAQGGPLGPKFTSLGNNVQQGPIYQISSGSEYNLCAKYLPPKVVDFVDRQT